MPSFVVYTDGSGGAAGPGGVAYVALTEDGTLHSEGSLPLQSATNQKAEILAAAYALHCLPAGSSVRVVTDSEYVAKGFAEWLPQWQKNGWRKRDGKPAANVAHWQRLADAAARHVYVVFAWIEGHAGHVYNERADVLAGEARQMAKRALV